MARNRNNFLISETVSAGFKDRAAGQIFGSVENAGTTGTSGIKSEKLKRI